MASGHLSCPACRVRVHANAPAIAVLEGRCPLCGATLHAVSSAAEVMGFRAFDLDALSEPEPEPDDRRDRPATPADLVARSQAASAQDSLAAHRWDDDGGRIAKEAEATW